MSTKEELAEARESAKRMMKNVLFPTVSDFNDLFKRARVITGPFRDYKSQNVYTWKLIEGGECYLSSYCSVSGTAHGYSPLDVIPHDSVIGAIGANMLLSKNYRINFEIVIREGGGGALVVARYDQILGDRWLAIIDEQTVPTVGETLKSDWTPRPLGIVNSETHRLTHQLLVRAGKKYGLSLEERTAGRYETVLPEKLVGNYVMVGLEYDIVRRDHVWVEVEKAIDENGNQIAGKIRSETKVEGFAPGDDVGLKLTEVEDVLSKDGKPTETDLAHCDYRGPDYIHILMREVSLDLPYAMAKDIWFGMSDHEKEFVMEVITKRGNEIHAAVRSEDP